MFISLWNINGSILLLLFQNDYEQDLSRKINATIKWNPYKIVWEILKPCIEIPNRFTKSRWLYIWWRSGWITPVCIENANLFCWSRFQFGWLQLNQLTFFFQIGQFHLCRTWEWLPWLYCLGEQLRFRLWGRFLWLRRLVREILFSLCQAKLSQSTLIPLNFE